MRTALIAVLATLAAATSFAASAQNGLHADTRQIDARQARQHARIEQGLAAGEFTRREARTLQQGQREIARSEVRAKADGRVTRREMQQLTALLDQADLQIRQFRHDRDGRRPA